MSRIHHGYVTHPGLVRGHNEDYFGFYPTRHGALIIVADGMGGMGGGALASELTVKAMSQVFLASPDVDPRAALVQAGVAANRAVKERAAQSPELEKMGSTVVAVIVRGDQCYYAHSGDSRLYLLRPGSIEQLTRDHTSVQQMVEAGLIRPEDAARHPMAHVVQKAVGHMDEDDLEGVDRPLSLKHGDTLLLCSDGLTELVTDAEVHETVARHDPQEACDRLLQLVLQRGGHDNVTIQIIRYGGKTWTARQRQTAEMKPAPGGETTSSERVIDLSWSSLTPWRKRGLILALLAVAALLVYLLLFHVFGVWPGSARATLLAPLFFRRRFVAQASSTKPTLTETISR